MPNYPITAVVPRVQYSASSLQTTFAYNWPIFTASDLKVYRTPNGQPADENADLLLLNVGYTVTGVGSESGGTIVLTVPATLDDTITIQREMAIERLTNYSNGNAIDADALNADFDRLTMMIQDLNVFIQKINTRYQVPDVIPPVQTLLPQLPQGWYWQGGPNGSVVPVQAEENPDASTLRTELAYNQTQDGAGANLVGYDDANAGPMTVRTKLDDLTDSLNIHVLSILSFGGDPTGVSNNTPALNAAYTYCAANGIGTIWFPRGTYKFTTQPDNAPQLIKLRGDGIALTTIERDFSSIDTSGLFMANGGFGLQVTGMSIVAMPGTSGGSAININSNVSFDNQINISDVAIVADSGSWFYGTIIDGNDACYIGYMSIKDVTMYGATTAELLLSNVFEVGLDIVAPTAVSGLGNVIITGDSTYPSYNVMANITICTTLVLDYLELSQFNLADCSTLENTSNVSEVVVYGNVPARQYNWVNSRYICSEDFAGVISTNGYQQFPNRLKMQWLSVSVAAGAAQNFSLPVAFTAANFGVCGYIQDTTVGGVEGLINNSGSNTLTTVNLQHSGSQTETYKILVLGY